MICSGNTSNLFFTPARSSSVLLMVLISVICGDTSCAMSLSPVEISTLRFCFAAAQASVPMTSSASTPGSRRIGRPMRLHRVEQRLDLRAQVVGHRRTMRLVLGEQVVAEGLAGRVEHHRDALGVVVLQELVEHVEHAEHRAGRFAARVGERRQRVKGAVQVGRSVDEDQIGTCAHASAAAWPRPASVLVVAFGRRRRRHLGRGRSLPLGRIHGLRRVRRLGRLAVRREPAPRRRLRRAASRPRRPSRVDRAAPSGRSRERSAGCQRASP